MQLTVSTVTIDGQRTIDSDLYPHVFECKTQAFAALRAGHRAAATGAEKPRDRLSGCSAYKVHSYSASRIRCSC